MYLVLGTSSRNSAPAAGSNAGSHAASGLAEHGAEAYLLPVHEDGSPAQPATPVGRDELPNVVRRHEHHRPRWVFERTRDWYPALLQSGAAIERCHDLSLSGAILSGSQFTAESAYASRQHIEPPETGQRHIPSAPAAAGQFALFDEHAGTGPPVEDLAMQLASQLEAVNGSTHPGRTRLLLAAESAGALTAVEMQEAGLPWRADVHDQLLTAALGPRPVEGTRPPELQRLAAVLGQLLNAPGFSPDSPQELIRTLHRAGVDIRSTQSWELEQQSHPAIEPLLEYKKLSRLLSANGWNWLDEWVSQGRFRPEYIPAGVVTGRWSSRGGGALQIPHTVRDAVRPDPGHRLVVADAAQLEPRILAALSQDTALAKAASGHDLYAGIAGQGFGERAAAKTALLGAMYGATTGEAGRLLPRLSRTYPEAVQFLEQAAQQGAAGGRVSSFLGRSCPPPSPAWLAGQSTGTAEEQQKADAAARSRGRFTRNFVVQSTAAEWALCWLAELRRRLRESRGGTADGPGAGELVFFVHDEVVVHAPTDRTEEAAGYAAEAAAAATKLLFGEIPVDIPVGIAVVDSYAKAK